MTTITLGKVKLLNRGQWSSTATYTKGDIVTYNGVSYVYKNEQSKSHTSLFFGPLSGFPLTGTVSSIPAFGDTFTIVWSSALPTVLDSRIVANSNIYVYSAWFEPDTKIISIVNNSTTSSTITVDKQITSATALGSHQVTIGTRRVANQYEVVLNETDWDLLSEGMVFTGDWSDSVNYLPGQIVVRNNNSYFCTQGNSNVDPIFDYIGVWEPFLIGDQPLPHQRIVCPVNGNPMNWRSHPYIPNPQWGTSNTYSGIPWNTPESHRSTGIAKLWAPQWNTSNVRGFINYRGALSLGADGRGHILGRGHGFSGTGAPGQHDAARAYTAELAAEYRNTFFTDENKHFGSDSFENNFRKSSKPIPIQFLHSYSSLAALLSDGSLLMGGTSSNGQLGTGDTSISNSPLVQLPTRAFSNRKIVKISSGQSYSTTDETWYMALDEYGEIWTWGNNAYGQLGVGPENHLASGLRRGSADSTEIVRSPMCLQKDIFFEGNRIVDIFTSSWSAYALDELGNLWAWGRNNNGQLGYATNVGYISTDRSNAPFKIPVVWSSFGGIQKICTPSYEGTAWLMVLDGQGHVWTQGNNSNGQLGTNNTTSDNNATGTLRRTSLVAGWSIGGGIRNIWASTGGNNLSFFLDSSLNLWATGSGANNMFGSASTTNRLVPAQMFGPGGNLTNIVSIATMGHSGGVTRLALDHNGITYGAGWNSYGGAGVGVSGAVGNNNVYNQQFGTSSTAAGWARCMLPSHFYEPSNKIVDIWGYGFNDGSYDTHEHGFWLTERGELLQSGYSYYHSGNESGNQQAPVSMDNFQ
jgi:alpha-tubulin suppressor-like RCC1 family protein